MIEQTLPAKSWVCPKCARRVPLEMPGCRCGHTSTKADLATQSSLYEPERSAGKTATYVRFGASLIVLLTAILGALVWTNRPTPAKPTAPLTLASAPTTSTSAKTVYPVDQSSPAAAPVDIAPTPAERVAAALAAGRASADVIPPTPAPVAAPLSEGSLEDMISRVMPAVVRVETVTGSGSGFFVRPDTLLTNVHVVLGNSTVTVRRPDGTTTAARVESTTPELDIAVLRVNSAPQNQATVTLGSGKHARAGQEVVALGSPLGFQNTVTRGIVSAVREVESITLVQTDAAINPGNSGGPLVDRSGVVIGITTMGMRPAVAQGLSFAVAIDHAVDLLAGKRPTATGTPITSLNTAMSNGTGRSEAESTRDQAARVFDQAIAQMEPRADALDDQWRLFKESCYQGRVVGSFDREWFALWNPRAMPGVVASHCGVTFNDLSQAAQAIRSDVVALGETARRADVYPGTRRDVLRKYRLDYAGWDR
jgi:S1-C subfamily serine protease